MNIPAESSHINLIYLDYSVPKRHITVLIYLCPVLPSSNTISMFGWNWPQKQPQKQNTDKNAEALTFFFLSIPNPTKFVLSFIFKIITSVHFA